ncbi:MAG TPA: Holliday junction resolvase RuvX [Rhabdochlamydiaceae bacterium]|nr:Holliday junction resolvase RuvX [Rhabdochlamydiaceae bacterium]
MPKSRIVGIDFGLVRMGIALSDERHLIAFPLKMVHTAKTLPATATLLAEELASHMPLHSLVIGLPLHLNGKESDMSLKVRALAQLLKSLLNIEIILWDERLSSAAVQRTFKEANISRKQQKNLIDKSVAAAILQNYLNSKTIS